MRPSRRRLTEQGADLAARNERLREKLADAEAGERACANQLERIAHELSRGKDVIATHMVAVAHPSTVLHSPQACMESLHEALTAVGFDLRIELERVDGSGL
ncbi:hypothetical protein GCM10023084_02610 [Streptomyces lacrimifluminis]|uniref:hypothetical protein n=1 Tax=Streptomyces lacrimifluminis TaxID=1500077 RepID=UPI0031ED89AF